MTRPSPSTDTTPESTDMPVGLRERSRRERYERIRAAAEDLFAEKSFDEVTTREVAQRAGVGEATLFRYIANKTDLILLVVGRRQDLLIDDIEAEDARAAETAPDSPSGAWFLARIEAIYRARIEFYAQDPENVAKYVVTGLQSESKFGDMSIRAGDRIISRVQQIILAGQRAGVLRDDCDARVVARNLNGTYIHEVLRSPARRLPIDRTWERLSVRIETMMRPMLVSEKQAQA